MCVNPISMWLCSEPLRVFGNFFVNTRQYHETVRLDKEYVFFGNKNQYYKRFRNVQLIYVPCGKCMTCLQKRSRQWSLRIGSEYLKYNKNCVLTLTYNDDNLPEEGLLNYKDIQLFLKRLRKKYKDTKIKFVCSCEYGKQTYRPHYHIILMNYFPPDVDLCKPYKITRKGSKLYKSKECDDLWSNGFVDVGLCDYHTSRYVAQYCMKKVINKNNNIWQAKNEASRERMICSQAIGLDYFKRNVETIFSGMKCIFGGKSFPIPKYFINKCKELYPKIYEKYKQSIRELMYGFELNFIEMRRRVVIENRYISMYNLFHSY